MCELALIYKKCYRKKEQMKKKDSPPEEIPVAHWADHAAEELLKLHPDKNPLVCASGISPSGVVHIGNFREVITVDFVVRSLKSRGKQVRFIYSWDDYDAFRKVPANLPEKELLEKNLRKPLAKIPDPFHEKESYALHFENRFETGLKPLEIDPEYIRQNQPYQRGDYAQGIKDALKNEKQIVEILNKYRTEPLPEDWTCVSIFCKLCDRDTTEVVTYTPPSEFKYRCTSCNQELETNIDQPNSGVKLLWRVDWPMRWAREGVDFEPGGKDHSSQGGSYATGVEIIRKVWKSEPPFYVQYDFVLAKGLGAKLSSSSGQLITLDEALEIYEPAVLRWIFASRKPNLDFSIAFDLDVLKTYDDFDRTTRIALKTEEAEEKKYGYEKRIYELSLTKPYPAPGSVKEFGQFPFRHLCNILQIHQGNVEKAKQYFVAVIKNKDDERRLEMRAKCAWRWITGFAPPEFKFTVRDAQSPAPKTKYVPAVTELVNILKSSDASSTKEDVMAQTIYDLMKRNQIEPKLFFQEVYNILIAKPNGPKLASFLIALGPKNAAEMLEKAL